MNRIESSKQALPGWSLKRWGLVAGPLVAVAVLRLVPDHYVDATGAQQWLGHAGRATLAIMAWMSIWWFTEATDITVTALLPLALFPVMGVMSIEATAAPYADKVIFLFMGGFLLALSMQRWGLGKRISLWTLRFVGTRPAHVIAAFMGITAVFSAFVSNAATVAMMLPIAISIIAVFYPQHESHERSAASGYTGDTSIDDTGQSFATCLMLAIAYAASVGGIATIIGTAPNVFLIGFLREHLPEPDRLDVGFAQWMACGTPLAIFMLVAIWLLLTKALYRLPRQPMEQGKALIQGQLVNMGNIRRGEWVTFVAFVTTVICWLTRPWLKQWTWHWQGQSIRPLAELEDSSIVMATALMLFLIPAGSHNGGYVMDWETAKRVPWNVLLLFGGGLSLAAAIKRNGVSEFLGSKLAFLVGQPDWVILLLIVAFVVILTEFTSNTATTASLLPVLAALAQVLDLEPAKLVIAAAISASCAFMLPVATPPNAIVFASGHVKLRQMVMAGFWINVVAIFAITLFSHFIVSQLIVWWRGNAG